MTVTVNTRGNRRIFVNIVTLIFRFSKFLHRSMMTAALPEIVTPQKSPCVFCNIVNKLENTEILYEDEDVCVFRDIKPATRFHILTIPKRHIEDAKALTSADKELVDHMLSVAKEMLTRNNLSIDNARLGYHWPPFRSVHHLHLHAIAPEDEMGFFAKLVFRKDSYWFVTPEYVASKL